MGGSALPAAPRGGAITRGEFCSEVARRARGDRGAHPGRTLAGMYEDTDYAFRKRLGQFATPPDIAEFMVSYGLRDGVRTVLDPACGTGVFLDKMLKAGSRATLYGIDVDPMMINACRLDLRARHGAPAARRLRLIGADYLAGGAGVPPVDFLVCNPPYVGFHGFDRGATSRIGREAGVKLSRLTNLYALFMLKAAGSVREGGTIVFITPAEFFYTGYGRAVKSFMAERLTLDALVTFDFARTVFGGALTTSTISIMTKKRPAAGHMVRLVSAGGSLEGVRAALKGGPQKGARARRMRQDRMDPKARWQNYFAGARRAGGRGRAHLVPLSSEAGVKRGIASGANAFFTLTDAELAQWGIEDRFVAPVVSRAGQAPGYEITKKRMRELAAAGHRVHLLYCAGPPSASVLRYARDGERRGIDRGYLCRHRSPWYSMEKRDPAPILATAFSRGNMRFVYNRAGCLNLAAYHGVYPRCADVGRIKALLCYLNSGYCMSLQAGVRREYGNGLHKFEPSDLLELPVIPVSRMGAGTVSELARLFDGMRRGEPRARERADKGVADAAAGLAA